MKGMDMSHFYGTLKGQRGEATRTGSKQSGLTTTAASWAGAIEVELYTDEQGRDCYRVVQKPWQGKGVSQPLVGGVLGEPHPLLNTMQQHPLLGNK